MNNRIMPYRIPSYIMTENGAQFLSKVFTTLCLFRIVKKLMTTADHLQANGQVERYNRTIVAILFYYVFEHQRDLYTYVQPLSYTYITQAHRTTGTSLFNVVLPTEPQFAATFRVLTGTPSNIPKDVHSQYTNHILLERAKLMRQQ